MDTDEQGQQAPITEDQAKAILRQAAEDRRSAFQQELDALLAKHRKRLIAVAVPLPREGIGPLVVGAGAIFVDEPETEQTPQLPT